MAAVAQLKLLLTALESAAASDQHAWLDDAHGLVIGSFPQPEMRFDFANEKLVSAKPKNSKEKKVISFLSKAKRVGEKFDLETEDAIYKFGSNTQLLIEGLNIIEDKYPGTLEKFSTWKGRSKRPVARNREDLYDVPHPITHSAELKSGHFVATNNKGLESREFLREAAQIAGLEWGRDFVVRRAD
jgi:hypothetical protein